ncbi:MAG: hypothetical protein AVDCRST_MAG13-3333, partial [uncultured Solirubrobacteraceae bacterium]
VCASRSQGLQPPGAGVRAPRGAARLAVGRPLRGHGLHLRPAGRPVGGVRRPAGRRAARHAARRPAPGRHRAGV